MLPTRTAIIADDEMHLAQDLQRRLHQLWPQLQILAVVHDGPATVQALAQHQPDIAFLDIRMPGLSGLEAARNAPAACQLVFVTAYDEHAVAAFDQAAVDYLLKPVAEPRLQRCIERLQMRTQAATDASANAPAHDLLRQLQALLPAPEKPAPLRWIRAQVGQNVRLVAVEEVCYFQSADKYTAVFTRDAELLLRTPLKDLLPQLDPNSFWQVHRGTVVNVSQIVEARHDILGRVSLRLRDRPETLAVSRSYAALFKQM